MDVIAVTTITWFVEIIFRFVCFAVFSWYYKINNHCCLIVVLTSHPVTLNSNYVKVMLAVKISTKSIGGRKKSWLLAKYLNVLSVQ